MNDITNGEVIGNLRESSFGGYHRIEFLAMGTCNEVMFSATSASMANAFRDDLLGWLDGFERRISRFRPESAVSEINREAGRSWVAIDRETEELLALCDWFNWKTGGIFDPTVLPLLHLWDYREEHAELPPSIEVARVRSLVGWRRVERRRGEVRLPVQGMAVDLGGIGKEYAVDKAIALARRHGIRDVMVNFGRDIRAFGHPPEGGPWRIGLESPDSEGACWGGVAIDDAAVCGSGTYARGFDLDGRRYGHIVDPRTGWPSDSGCSASWVIAPSCTEAGILSTAAVVLGVEEGIRLLESTWRAAGSFWTPRGIHHSRRMHEYFIDNA